MSTNKLIQNLQNPALYDHPITTFKVIETHISWVILTGEFAYKIKKPVDFVFLDFSTLEKRHFYCHEELRLNKPNAPSVYLDVVTIHGDEENPSLNGTGPVIEYMLKMREFSQDLLFSQLLTKQLLTREHIMQLAKKLGEIHLQANLNGPATLGTVEQVHQPVVQNFDQCLPFLHQSADLVQLDELRNWANKQHQILTPVFVTRKELGFIRECHGDLHLGNIALLNGQPTPFDCIEFNEPFRWTDVMADVGFLLMDLHDKGRIDFANCFLNSYLAVTGDYLGLPILRYYHAYRAMVRAKVALFSMPSEESSISDRDNLLLPYRRYTALAEQDMHVSPPFMLITHGLSGSGKSTLAQKIVEQLGSIQIRSDVERKRLAGLNAQARNNAAVNSALYSPDNNANTYTQLANLAQEIIQAGYSVIVDATFLLQSERQQFQALAASLQVPFAILHCHAPEERLQTIVERRAKSGKDASEANLEVLTMQQDKVQGLTEEEQHYTVTVDTSLMVKSKEAVEELVEKVQKVCGLK
ncbi:bifunctional aminoglycoside phosphotransferase/ATP-binding protein [soil metagenome]